MKRTIMLVMVILGFSLCVNAQDGQVQEEQTQEEQAPKLKKVALSLGPEWNMNSPHNFAGGISLAIHYNLTRSVAIGLTITGSSNFFGFYVIEEPALLLRWYLFTKDHTGVFIETDVGGSLAVQGSEVSPYFLGGIRGGYRLPLGSSFFIEPYGRAGYPFAFGLGVLAGVSF